VVVVGGAVVAAVGSGVLVCLTAKAAANGEKTPIDIADVNYDQRYDDVAYWRIRGREQQLIDSLGGARSDTGEP
jgi:hypothetical protein